MPSSHKAREAMLSLCDETRDGPVYELGSGWGHVLIALARHYPQRQIIGYELSLLPWLVSVVLVKLFGLRNVQVRRENFLQADLRGAKVLVCYLYPGGMLKIQDKLKAEKGAFEYLISHHFALPSFVPFKTIQLNDLYKTPVYLYQVC